MISVKEACVSKNAASIRLFDKRTHGRGVDGAPTTAPGGGGDGTPTAAPAHGEATAAIVNKQEHAWSPLCALDVCAWSCC